MATGVRQPAGVTRQRILDSAWELMVERGPEVSMAEIAGAAGVSRQAVYLHFATRGALLMALVQRADERFGIREGLTKAMSMESAAERLDACLRVWFGFVVRILPVAGELIRRQKIDADAAAAWQDRTRDLREFYRRLVRSISDEGALAPEWSVDEAADYLWATSSVQNWELLVLERGWSERRASRILRRTITAALLAPS